MNDDYQIYIPYIELLKLFHCDNFYEVWVRSENTQVGYLVTMRKWK